MSGFAGGSEQLSVRVSGPRLYCSIKIVQQALCKAWNEMDSGYREYCRGLILSGNHQPRVFP